MQDRTSLVGGSDTPVASAGSDSANIAPGTLSAEPQYAHTTTDAPLSREVSMTLVDRVRNICVSPATEWPVIERETTQPAELVTGYLVPLAAVGAVAGLIGSVIVGAMIASIGVRVPLLASLIGAVVSVVFTVLFCFVIAFIINALAPTFGGRPDSNQALKTAVYSYTPALAAGVTRVIPLLGNVVVFVASLYSLYVLYLGLPGMMKAPKDRAPGYTVVVVIASIVIGVVVSGLFALLGGLGILGAGMV
jgi:hypothetical protein